MFRILLWVAAALTLAGCDRPLFAPPLKQAHPGIWVVRDADTTVYLFGTVHVLRPDLHWFNGKVRSAFDASDELVLEMLQPTRDELRTVRQDLALYKGPELAQHLSPQTLGRLHRLIAQRGMRADAVDWFEPWYVAIVTMQLGLRDTPYRAELGVEPILSRQAALVGKPVTGLETMREQFGYFDRLPPAAQEQLLSRALDSLAGANARFDAVADAWGNGDAARLAALMNEELKDSPELAEALVGARNRRWADWISARMAKPGTIFVAVGAGHLAGPQSLQAELARRGLKVERVAN